MGKGDIRSKKGKMKNGSFGKTRRKRKSKNNKEAAVKATS